MSTLNNLNSLNYKNTALKQKSRESASIKKSKEISKENINITLIQKSFHVPIPGISSFKEKFEIKLKILRRKTTHFLAQIPVSARPNSLLQFGLKNH